MGSHTCSLSDSHADAMDPAKVARWLSAKSVMNFSKNKSCGTQGRRQASRISSHLKHQKINFGQAPTVLDTTTAVDRCRPDTTWRAINT